MVEEVNGIHFEAKEEGDAENMRQRLPAIHERAGHTSALKNLK